MLFLVDILSRALNPGSNDDDAGKEGALLTRDLLRTGAPKIRCPKCAWQPRAESRWYCYCGFMWNTFDTRGLCPACDYQWTDTACLQCSEWSPHKDWYADEPASPPAD